MVSAWFLSLFAVAAAGAPANTMGDRFKGAAQDACALVWSEKATDAALSQQVYQPMAALLVKQVRTVFAKPPEMLSSTGSEGTQHYMSPAQPQQSFDLPQIREDEPLILANAAGGVADMVVERYRETFREANEPVPTLVTYRTPGEDEDSVTRISQDVRSYCGMLKEKGLSELYPSNGGR